MAITKRKFDVVIVGAGGAGMRAALQLSEAGLKVAVLSFASWMSSCIYKNRLYGAVVDSSDTSTS